jgi:hypothetical protein
MTFENDRSETDNALQGSETETSSAPTLCHSRCKQLDMGLHRAGKPEQATFYA